MVKSKRNELLDMKRILLFVVLSAFAFATVRAAEYTVSLDEVARVLATAGPGDRIIVKNGVYCDLELKWSGRGAENRPVRIEAETPGGVVIEGGSTLRLAGEWLEISGLTFRNGYAPRGSAFGRTLQPQLSQASFENLLAAEMLKTDARQDLRLWVLEDESRMIGSNHLPECLRERMTQAAIAVVEDPFEIRLERLNEEYFLRMHHDFTHAYGDEQGWQEYCEYLHHGLSAIKRRLGLQRYNELAAQLDTALTTQLTTGSTDGHLAWLVPLLKEYYDPMYRYQLEKKAEKVVFRGEWAEVAEWVKAR